MREVHQVVGHTLKYLHAGLLLNVVQMILLLLIISQH